MASKIVITGAQGGIGPNNSTPSRLELNTVLANKDQTTLLLLGMERMQARPESDPKSWYQVGGIHGRPYTPWQGETDSAGRKPGGYCTHSSILFLTWHRPYLALFEQALYEDVQAVAASFPEPRRSQLAKVAVKFRMPYWDWAGTSQIPQMLLQPKVDVEKPTGVVKIPNPLYSYNFRTSELKNFTGRYQSWKRTLRRPVNDGTANDNINELMVVFQNSWNFASQDTFPGQSGAWMNLRERVWHLLNLEQNRYPTYAAFSNNRWVPNNRSSDYDSLESVHDSIHGIVGGDGHMGNIGYAGFDPIFWLHHCNVDRLYAIWQALHPSEDLNWKFDIPEQTEHNFHWWVPGSGNKRQEKESTPLVPFHKNPSGYWDSNSVRNLKAFGYTYPELVDWGVVSREQLRASVAEKVRALYGRAAVPELLVKAAAAPQAAKAEAPVSVMAASVEKSGAPSPQAIKATTTPPAVGLQNVQVPLMAAAVTSNIVKPAVTPAAPSASVSAAGSVPKATPKPAPAANPEPPKQHREYFANIRAPKYDFGGPFAVHVFLGDFTDDPKTRQFDPNLVGSWNVFATDIATTGCANCKTAAKDNLVVTGSVPLTRALARKLGQGLESLEINHVTPYLTQNLHWRIHQTTHDQTNIDRHSCDDKVKFAVTSAIITYPAGGIGMPVYSDWNPIPEITAGRPTGVGFNDAEGYEDPGDNA